MDGSSAIKFRISLLGGLELAGPSGSVYVPGKKQAALLAYLACTQETRHTREKLTALFWGTYPELQARQSLRQALSAIRKIIGQSGVIASGDTVSLRPGTIQCDVSEFEALLRDRSIDSLKQAVDLYKGALLANNTLDEESWSEWLITERQRLEDLALDACVTLGEACLDLRRPDAALRLAQRAVSINVLREDAHRLAIKACVAGGRTSDALRRYNTLVSVLQRELGVEPDEMTRKLIDDVRAGKRSGSSTRERPAPDLSDATALISPEAPRTILAVDRTPIEGELRTSALQESGRDLALLSKGRLVDKIGHTLLIDFPDARSAVQAGQTAQQSGLRVAAHASDDRNEAKDVAAGLANLARPGHLLVSADVSDMLTDGVDGWLEDLGEQHVGSTDALMRTFRVMPIGLTQRQSQNPSGEKIKPAIAVIPFAGRTSKGDNIVGHLLADEIIDSLCQTQELAIISKMSTRAFRNLEGGAADIGKQLGAEYVLWGNCDLRGQHVHVSAELIDVGSEEIIWNQRLSAHERTLAHGCPDVVESILGEVQASILTHELRRAQARPLESLQNYSMLAAAISLIHRTSPGSFAYARQLLQVLSERLPNHALPQAWLAQWHVTRVNQGRSDNVAEEGRLALDCAIRANELDPACSIAITMDGWVHTHLLKSLDVAAERFDLAVRVNSSDSMAWLLKGTMHAFKGNGDEAVRCVNQAVRLSPFDPRRSYYDSLVATAYLSAGMFEDAIKFAKESFRVNRLHSSTLRALAIAQVLSGRLDEARHTVSDLLLLEPKLTVSNYLQRHPAAAFPTGKVWAEALREAGVPK